MKVKVLRGFSTRALGKRAEGDVFEVPEGAKVGKLQAEGYLAPSRSEPTVAVAPAAAEAVSPPAPRAPAKKSARRGTR